MAKGTAATMALNEGEGLCKEVGVAGAVAEASCRGSKRQCHTSILVWVVGEESSHRVWATRGAAGKRVLGTMGLHDHHFQVPTATIASIFHGSRLIALLKSGK